LREDISRKLDTHTKQSEAPDGEKSNEHELHNDANLELQSRDETQNRCKKNM
jgi:hypothetical protein